MNPMLLIRKALLGLMAEPEEVIKKFLQAALIFISIILIVFVLPSSVILSLPSIMLQGDKIDERQLEIVGYYKDAPDKVDEENKKWIEQQKDKYSWCDDIKVEYDFDLSWQQLIAIDSVILNQDFKNADEDKIIRLGERFVIKKTRTEKYTVTEHRSSYSTNSDGSVTRRSYTVQVEKTRAIITVETKSMQDVFNEIGFSKFDQDLAMNIYNTIISSDIEGAFNLYDDVNLGDLKEYGPGGSKLPYFNQTDKRWAGSRYGTSNIKKAGCGPTALAMVIGGLTGNSNINPKVIADWSAKNGHVANGQGSYWTLMASGGKSFGLDVDTISRKDPSSVAKALSEGKPIVVSMGRGHFTQGGHFIVLTGITADGKVTVQDPASVKRSNQTWDLGLIMNESSKNGGSNGSPFWVFN